jgi:hypothetical protein
LTLTPLKFGKFYHIYNRGNNQENIFIQPRNYTYFLELWWKHTFEIAETFTFCLLKNHFHAVVYIKEIENIYGDLSNLKKIHEDRVAGVDIDLCKDTTYRDLTGFRFFTFFIQRINVRLTGVMRKMNSITRIAPYINGFDKFPCN